MTIIDCTVQRWMENTSSHHIGFPHILFHTQSGKNIPFFKTKAASQSFYQSCRVCSFETGAHICSLHLCLVFHPSWHQETECKHGIKWHFPSRPESGILPPSWHSSGGLKDVLVPNWNTARALDHLVLMTLATPMPFWVMFFWGQNLEQLCFGVTRTPNY